MSIIRSTLLLGLGLALGASHAHARQASTPNARLGSTYSSGRIELPALSLREAGDTWGALGESNGFAAGFYTYRVTQSGDFFMQNLLAYWGGTHYPYGEFTPKAGTNSIRFHGVVPFNANAGERASILIEFFGIQGSLVAAKTIQVEVICTEGDFVQLSLEQEVTGGFVVATYEGLHGVSRNGGLLNRHWTGSGWEDRPFSPNITPTAGSLIQGERSGSDANLYYTAGRRIYEAFMQGGAPMESALEMPESLATGSLVHATYDGAFEGLFTCSAGGQLYFVDPRVGASTAYAIPSTGRPVVPSSLIAGGAPQGGWGAYCVSNAGDLSVVWDDAGTYKLATIDAAFRIVCPDSLVLVEEGGYANGVLYVTSQGRIRRSYWENGGWIDEGIHHWGGMIVGSSMVSARNSGSGSSGGAYCVNKNGQICIVYRNGSNYSFGIIPGLSGVLPESLTLSDQTGDFAQSNGLYSVTETGELMRTYWNGQWAHEQIPTYGPRLLPETLAPSVTSGADSAVCGLNICGDLFLVHRVSSGVEYVIVE